MRPKTFSIVLVGMLGMLVVALLYVALRAGRAGEELDAQRVVALRDQERLRHELQTTERAQADAEQQGATFKAALAALKAKPAPAAAPASARTGPISLAAVHVNHPELANLWIAAQKATLNQNYGPLFQALGLSSERAEQLKTLMARQIARHSDIEDATTAKGLDYHAPEVRELLRQTDAQITAAEAALLGPDRFQQLQNYQRSLAPRGMVDGLAGAVAFSDPLTAQQGNELTRILANASPAYRAGSPANFQEVDWSLVDDQARTVLSPAQFAIWQQDNPRDLRGGYARADIQLRNAYDEAVKAEKEREAADHGQAPPASSP